MQVKLIKKKDMQAFRPYVHGVKDYRKVLNFKVDDGWIDKTPVCTASTGKQEDHCLGFRAGSSGRCVFQNQGPFRTECSRGKE